VWTAAGLVERGVLAFFFVALAFGLSSGTVSVTL
jgi:hypothetical protein